ncbi:pseudouridine synthase [Myxococcus sp. K15C18031901]|uniref:pseudouridine synthase n=1 Tax=Myxococcus dinghuensis TaxID=2906761 RepID=UPI0020A7793E|nr:pseudouridine synthase [Myxococcus dinghuensis]MCP3103939.1 pseudouridine synthase [Myxococcus dinghuensis]
MAAERLQKYLARAGVASRRHAEELITAGRVAVNNTTVTELGSRVEPGTDLVSVDGKLVTPPDETSYFLLYKPVGVVTTLSDPQGRPTVASYVEETGKRLFPVGRLDYDAEGALLFTDDGALAHKLTHPSFQVPRTYLAKVKGVPDKATLDKLRGGVRLEDGMATPVSVDVFEAAEKNTWLKIVVAEGRPHLIKRLCAAVGHPVVRLFRPAYAGVGVEGLRPGELRPLKTSEVDLLNAVSDGKATPPSTSLRLPPRRHGRAAPGFDESDEDELSMDDDAPAPRKSAERSARKAPARAGAGEKRSSWKPAGEGGSSLARFGRSRGASAEGRPARREWSGDDEAPARSRGPRAEGAGGERPQRREWKSGGEGGSRFGGARGEGRPARAGAARFDGAGAKARSDRGERSGGSRFGGEGRAERGGPRAGGEGRPPRAGSRFGGEGRPERSGGSRFGGEARAERSGGSRFGGEGRAPRAGGSRFGGEGRPERSGGSRFGGAGRGPRAGGEDRAERSGGSRFGGAGRGPRAGGEDRAERSGGSRFGGEGRPPRAGSRFGSEGRPERSGPRAGGEDRPPRAGSRFGGEARAERSGGSRFGGEGRAERSGPRAGGEGRPPRAGSRFGGEARAERSGGSRFGGEGRAERSGPRAGGEGRPPRAGSRFGGEGRAERSGGSRFGGEGRAERSGGSRFGGAAGRPARREWSGGGDEGGASRPPRKEGGARSSGGADRPARKEWKPYDDNGSPRERVVRAGASGRRSAEGAGESRKSGEFQDWKKKKLDGGSARWNSKAPKGRFGQPSKGPRKPR